MNNEQINDQRSREIDVKIAKLHEKWHKMHDEKLAENPNYLEDDKIIEDQKEADRKKRSDDYNTGVMQEFIESLARKRAQLLAEAVRDFDLVTSLLKHKVPQESLHVVAANLVLTMELKISNFVERPKSINMI